MDIEVLKNLISKEYANAYNEILSGELPSIPVRNGKQKSTFLVKSTRNWGLTTHYKREKGLLGETTTRYRLNKLVDLGLISIDDFNKYSGENLHKLVSCNNSDAKYVLLFLMERIKGKFPNNVAEIKSSIYQPNELGFEEEVVRDEGGEKTIIVNTYERDPILRKLKIKECQDNLICSICGFNFEKFYGDTGKGFIHVHHLKPLSKIKKTHKAQLKDLVLVCPNCHAMLHRQKDALTPDELKSRINNN